MRAPLLWSVALIAVLSGCGGKDDGPRPKPRPTTRTVVGYQFALTLPASWSDVGDQVGVKGLADDVAYADRSAKGFKPTILVGRDNSQMIRRTETKDLAVLARRYLARQDGLRPGPITRTTLSGSNASQIVTVGDQGGMRLERRDVLAKHRGTLYTVVYTTAAGTPGAEQQLRRLLAGFRWTS